VSCCATAASVPNNPQRTPRPLSSFLFTSLWKVHGANPDDAALGAEAFGSIRHWSLGADLFKSRVLLIPINLFLHWSLAIVVFNKHVTGGAFASCDLGARGPGSQPLTRV
jgi:Ulp1 family protease